MGYANHSLWDWIQKTEQAAMEMGRWPEFWKTAFYLLILVYGLVILLTFQNYGFTADEQSHTRYGEALLKWYTSGFQNQDVFASKNTWLYGGLFDLSVTLIGHLLPLEPHDSRHLCNAFVGLLGIVAAYKMGELLGGSPAGFLSALFLLLTPRYYGHAFNNPKDIPFAVCYLWSLFYLIRTLRAFPDLNKNLIWKTGLTIGLALAVRVGGCVLIVYLSLFLFLKWLQEGRPNPIQTAQRALFILFIAYLTMILFWPWAQVHPLAGPWEAIHTFSSFPEIHYHLFDGRYIGSNETSRFYVLQWILLTLTEFVFLGLIARLYTWFRKPHFDWTGQDLLAFSVLFPLGYALLVHIPFYDGLRHVLFVLPPVVILSATGIVDLYRRIQSEMMRRGFCTLVGFLLVLTLW
ncbi:MAG: glycosyltransferase family 39 protein, partial [bacterium]|nr:glycosyltransferase family 39 protein [bacterium]